MTLLDKENLKINDWKLKNSDNWASPKWILDLFEGFYDPCPLNSKENGLLLDWKDKTYVNPPYSNPEPFIRKAIEENKKGKFIVMLLPVDTSTKWFLALKEAKAHIILPNERLKFNGSNKNARWACMLVILEKGGNKE